MDHTGESRDKSGDLGVRPAGEPTVAQIRNQLAKMLASQTFRSSEGQRAFLRHAVEQAITGRGDLLKEYTIGTEALGRPSSFDPRLDPIVRTQASKLRARLSKYFENEGAQDALRIELPKGSYLPVFRVAAIAEPPAEVPVPKPAPEASVFLPTASPGQTHLRWKFAAITLALLGLAGTGALYVLRWELWREAPAPARRSVAVMPFVNVSDHNGDEFLSDGLTGELIDSLSRVPDLQVVARSSSVRFKGPALKAATVLEGSVLRSGNRLAVTAQLNNAADGYRLWSGSFERESSNAAEGEKEIARSIASALKARFASTAIEVSRKAFFNPASPSTGAYQDYLRGRYSWSKLNIDGLNSAMQYFRKSIGEDPSYARAYTALADSYVMAPQVAAAWPSEVVSKIRAAASKALELDPSSGEAHFDLAISAEYEYDWRAAEREFTKGLALNPGNAVGHLWYAKLLGLMGRREQVLKQRRIAAELDPVSPYAVQSVGGYYSVVGRYDEAIAEFQAALELEPNFGLAHQGLGVAYVLKGMDKKGIDELRLAQKLMPGPRRLALLGYGYGYCGRTAEARQILDDLLRQSERTPLPALAIAQVYIGLGDKDRAFEWLEKAVDQNDLDLTLQWDSLYGPLRSDPRYFKLLRRMKLV